MGPAWLLTTSKPSGAGRRKGCGGRAFIRLARLQGSIARQNVGTSRQGLPDDLVRGFHARARQSAVRGRGHLNSHIRCQANGTGQTLIRIVETVLRLYEPETGLRNQLFCLGNLYAGPDAAGIPSLCGRQYLAAVAK